MASVFDLHRPHAPTVSVAAGARSLGEVFQRRARATPEAAASFFKHDGAWRRIDWGYFYTQARAVAAELDRLGLERGDRVAILGPTHPDWGRYDLGAQLLGLVTVGIYPSQSPEQVRYLLEHSASRVVFVAGAEELETVLRAAEGNRGLRAIVPWEEELVAGAVGRDPRVVSPRGFRGEPLPDDEVDRRLAAIDPETTAILIYTSGTTGPPKGAMISHANILALMASQDRFFRFYDDDLLLSFLPMAHATERVMAFYIRLSTGVAAAYASSIGAVLGEIQEVRPTVFGSVPRLFEKLYAGIHGEVARAGGTTERLFAWAERIGRTWIRQILHQHPVSAGLALQYGLARRLVFARIHRAMGGRVRACLTGAAPISFDILEFLWAVGLPVYEAYGMTEATVVTHFNRPEAMRLGTVGQPIPPMEQRIADDGEILLRGPFVFQGYYENPEATAETLRDGWLHTGDVGTIDADGFLRITDRKKHLIITAGGKNIAPANIERAIKSQSPLVSQVHAHGDRRAYVTALVAPSPLETVEWGAEHDLVAADELATRRRELQENPTARSAELNRTMATVVADERFRALLLDAVRAGNRQLARVERVRRFHVLGRDFSVEAGEMTPTMKLKRRAVEEAYRETFDRIYDEPGFAINAETAEGTPGE